MARKATQASLWLPGFDIEARPIPISSEPSDEVATAPSAFNGDAPSSQSTHTTTAPELPRPWRPTTIRAANQAAIAWPHWPSSVLDELDGQATKFDANLEAIAVLRAVEKEARAATEDERAALLRFTGWGGIPASFNLEAATLPWKQRAQQLLDAAPAAEYESAKASVNNSHYTEPVRHPLDLDGRCAVWVSRAARILDPSSGIGHFIGCMPPDIATRSRITAVELDDRRRSHPQGAVRAPRGRRPHRGVRSRRAGRLLASIWSCRTSRSATTRSATAATGPTAASASTTGSSAVRSTSCGPAGWCASSHRPGSSTSATARRAPTRRRRPTWSAAIRLPQGTFSRLASTDVQADIVVLRRRLPRRPAAMQADWLDLDYRARGAAPSALPRPATCEVNAWYVGQPAQRARPLRQGHARLRSRCRRPSSTATWKRRCGSAIDLIPGGILHADAGTVRGIEPSRRPRLPLPRAHGPAASCCTAAASASLSTANSSTSTTRRTPPCASASPACATSATARASFSTPSCDDVRDEATLMPICAAA